jgi:UDP-GlcNAc:undecaprenyl-phosphate GlcNAc-1-phosphate transferase
MGLNQKQAVAILYCVSAVFGLSAVVLATSGAMKALLLILAFLATGLLAVFVFRSGHRQAPKPEEKAPGQEDPGAEKERTEPPGDGQA